MFSKRLALSFAALLILLVLAACESLPATTQVSTAQPPPSQALPVTTVKTASPPPTLAPTNTPPVPDAKTDPASALLYASTRGLFKTAEFAYTYTTTIGLADLQPTPAPQGQGEPAQGYASKIQGAGALEVTDPAARRFKMRLDMNIDSGGESMRVQIVMIDQTAWVNVANQGNTWQMTGIDRATALTPGANPEAALRYIKDAADVKWVEDVTRGAETLSHLRFTMDYDKLDVGAIMSELLPDAQVTTEQLRATYKDIDPSFDVWLSRPSLELREEQGHISLFLPMAAGPGGGYLMLRTRIDMDMQFSKVNEPVTIEAPTENVTPVASTGAEAGVATATPSR